MKRTAEDVCIEYALAAEAVREHKRYLNDRSNFCEGYEPAEEEDYATNYPGYRGTSRNSCLEEYDALEEVDKGAFIDNEMCSKCKVRLNVRFLLWLRKKDMQSAKRSVEAVGKRLNKREDSDAKG